MTVWVFGASFSHIYEGLTDQWLQQVATNLNTNLENFSIVGSCAEYSYHTFNKNKQLIRDNDIVIVPLTTHSRRWFFKDRPEHNAVPVPGHEPLKLIYDTIGVPEIDEAMEKYETYLSNRLLVDTYLYNFLMNLNYQSYKKNLKTIVMIGYYDTDHFLKDKKNDFKHLHFAKGRLVDISINELSKDFVININPGSTFQDLRVNHMIRSNHNILANKIVNYIKSNQNIDLTQGFDEKVVSLDKWKDPFFTKEELFNGAVSLVARV